MSGTHGGYRSGLRCWLNHITRDLLNSRYLRQAIAEWSITGLTFNTSLFKHAIENTAIYDSMIINNLQENNFGEELLFQMATEDVRCAADLLRSTYNHSDGLEGWAAMDVSPLLVHDKHSCVCAAKLFYDNAFRPNIFVGVPGTPDGLATVEEATFLGVPVHVTLLFSCEQYLAAAFAYMSGLERRIAAGLKADVRSVASIATHSWDAAVADKAPSELIERVGIAIARRTYDAWRRLLASRRWKYVSDQGASPQRLYLETPQIKVPIDRDIPSGAFTICSLSEITLQTFSRSVAENDYDRHGNGPDSDIVLERLHRAGVEIQVLADRLQVEGFEAEVKAWIDLLSGIANKSATLAKFASDRSVVSARLETSTDGRLNLERKDEVAKKTRVRCL
jgi:transaldolase